MSPSGGGKGDDAYFVQGTFLDYIWNTYPGDVAQALAVAWHIRKTLPEQMDRPKLQTLSTTPPPSRNSNRGGGEDVTGLPGTQASTRQSLRRKTYDIPTLLSLRHAQGPWPVLLRVKPEAIAENIFQYMGARTIQRLSGRPHCLSEVSNGTHFDIKLVDNIPHRPSNGPKSTSTNKSHRQVPLPLDIPCSQRNDGFVRFLQRHASPPHHRVTAGGRIVPAGPLSPPPMLDYASLNTFVRERAAAVDDLQNEDHGVQSNTRAHSADTKTNPRTMPYNYRSIQGGGMTGQTTYPMGSAQPVTAHDSFTYSYQPFLSGSMQAPAGMLPIGTFPDGSTLVSYDGLTYRTYWNGLNTVVEPLQSFQQPIGPAYYSAVHPQIPSNISSFNLPPPSQRASRISAPLTNITSGSRGSNEQVSEVMANQSSADKETELKSQLTNLDKHLALYHYEISQAERAEFITQRRYLVETIDKIRVAKEKSTRSIPIIAPTTGLPVTPLHGKIFDGNVPKLSALQAAGSKSRVGGKGLSPAAAPFIPGKYRNASSEKSTKRTLEDVANAAIARKSKALNVPDSSGSTQVKSRTEGSTSSGLDPSDPAMRVIDHEDIEYAGRYLYNWDLEQKRYCTTVAEFQEAVRQVREQARRYGCLGGQSKDPAYDAEQDIWWAICDRDPIPLPPAIPDYITIPRQWNWEDSIFNFRRKGAPLAGREVEDARNSPRLVGWDTALTESMKDRIDVTRSYFASKGQLPSVPFRTWNYDLKGNKIEVDSNTGSASQAFRSPDDTEQNVTKDPVTTPSRTLKTLTKNDVNSRENSPRVPSRSQGGRKMYATEGDDLSQMKCYVQDGLRPLSPPSTSNAGFERSMQIRLGKVGVDHSEESNHSITPSRSRQLHVQNCPETPTPHRSNGRPKNILTNNNRLNDTSPTAGWKPVKDGAGNEIIIESTLDPIWDGQYPIYDSRNPNYAKFSSLARKNKFAKAQADVDLEANALPSGHYRFFDHPEDFHPDLNNAEKIKTAKVDLPPANELSPSLGHHHDLPNTSFISITNSEKPGAQDFLRKMLQSPTYVTNKPVTGMTSGLAERLTKFLRGVGEGTHKDTQRARNKENAPSNPSGQLADGAGEASSGLTSPFKSDPDTSITKALSTLASSSHAATGFLSPNSEVQKPYAASSQPRQFHDSPSEHPHVRADLSSSSPSTAPQPTPTSSASYGRRTPGKHNSAVNQHIPMSFGLDGGSDQQIGGDEQGSKTTTQKHADFDYKGVTHADYDIKREDPNNEWHKGAVEDYFQDLAARERQEIAVHQQFSSKASK